MSLLKQSDNSSLCQSRPRPHKVIMNTIFRNCSYPSGHVKLTLKNCLQKKLKEWSSILDAGNVYVNQPITASSIDQDGKKHSSNVSNMDQLVLEQCRSNARVVVYAEAGMGKTTVLRHIARSWLEGTSPLVDRFDYVFLIPLRLARSHTMIEVIRQDLGLLPQDYKDTLGKILATSNRVLFLLDSYEELSFDIDDINRLITRDAHSGKSVMVVVSSRPGSGLGEVIGRLTDYIIVDLKDFTDQDIERYFEKYSADAEEREHFVSIIEKFGKDFLKRPINLSLVCYLYKTTDVGNTGTEGEGISQTKLFSEMVKHILNVYLRKNCQLERKLDALSLLGSKDRKLGPAKAMLEKISRLCYQARRKNHQLLYTQNCEDFIDFGLFTPGTDKNSVVVPHLLIMEFFAAVHLVGSKEAWTEMFEEVDGKCTKGETRRSLEDVVMELGLENITMFVVGLSPDVAQQLHSLFAIKQQRIWYSGYCQSVYSYQLQLLQESEVKSAMAEALCNAHLITVRGHHPYKEHIRPDQLLDVFTVEQSHHFLAKAYDCDMKSNSARGVTMRRTNTDRDKKFLCDSYVVRCLQKFRCTSLEMGEKMRVEDCDISVEVLSLLISAVSEKLSIYDCRLLCAERGERIQRLLQPMPAPTLLEIYMGLRGSELSVNVLRPLISAVSEKLSIYHCRLLCAESGEHIQRLLQPMPAPTVRKIFINDTELSVNILRLLISAVSEELSIKDCRLLCAERGEHIQRLLQPMPAPTLREIYMGLRGSELSVNVLRLLISAVSEKLSMEDCRLLCAESGQYTRILLQPMPAPALRDISIDASELSAGALRVLISAVSEELSIEDCGLLCAERGENIQRLLQPIPASTVRHIFIGASELSLDALRLLISAVSEEVSIEDCGLLCAERGENIQRLLQPIPASTVRHISIGASELSLDTLRLLISAVSEKLSIYHCSLLCAESGEHIQRLLQPLPAPTLRDISIDASELSVDALRLLISAASDNLSIKKCTLLCSGEKEDSIELVRNTRPVSAPTVRVTLWHYLSDQSGRYLTKKESKQTVRDICSSAAITAYLWVSQWREFRLNTRFFASFLAWQMSKFYERPDLSVK